MGAAASQTPEVAAPGIQVTLYRPLAGEEGQGEQGQSWLAAAHTLTGPDGGYAFAGLGRGIDYRVHFVDPAGQYASQYYDNKLLTFRPSAGRGGTDLVARVGMLMAG